MEINIEYTSVFERTLNAVEDDSVRFVINQGGARSSKTWSACQMVVYAALTRPGVEITCVAKTMPQLKRTALKDFIEVMRNAGLYEDERYWTDQRYEFSNGSVVEFFSVDQGMKIRGTSRDLLYITEANSLWDDDFVQLNMRTRWKIIMDFNPDYFPQWLDQLMVRPNSRVMHSTFRDNPYLPQEQIDEIEYLRHTDEGQYTIYNLGQRAQTKEHVLSHWKVAERPEDLTLKCYGLDFGYTHPMALVRVWHDGTAKRFHLEEVVHESNMLMATLIDRMHAAGITTETILCDSARPEFISELQLAGFRAQGADKSVKAGLNAMKSAQVTVEPSSKRLISDLQNTRYKKLAGRITEEIEKIDDDGTDASRYACLYLKNSARVGSTKVMRF